MYEYDRNKYGMPTEIHRKLKGEMNLVQDAVILGTLLDCFAFGRETLALE
jgi:hypothetical protein